MGRRRPDAHEPKEPRQVRRGQSGPAAGASRHRCGPSPSAHCQDARPLAHQRNNARGPLTGVCVRSRRQSAQSEGRAGRHGSIDPPHRPRRLLQPSRARVRGPRHGQPQGQAVLRLRHRVEHEQGRELLLPAQAVDHRHPPLTEPAPPTAAPVGVRLQVSTCKLTDNERMVRLMGQMEGRLTYKRAKGV